MSLGDLMLVPQVIPFHISEYSVSNTRMVIRMSDIRFELSNGIHSQSIFA